MASRRDDTARVKGVTMNESAEALAAKILATVEPYLYDPIPADAYTPAELREYLLIAFERIIAASNAVA